MSVRMSLVSISKVVDYEYSPFFLRDSRANETQARVKITTRERRDASGREKNEGLLLLYKSGSFTY